MRRQENQPSLPIGGQEPVERAFILTPLAATTDHVDPVRLVALFQGGPTSGFTSFKGLRQFVADEVSNGPKFVTGAISFKAKDLRIMRVPPGIVLNRLDDLLAKSDELDGLVFAGAHGDRLRLRGGKNLLSAITEVRCHEFANSGHISVPRRVRIEAALQERANEIQRTLGRSGASVTEGELLDLARSYPRPATRPEFYVNALIEIRGERHVTEPMKASFVWGDANAQSGGYFGWMQLAS